MDDWRDEGSPDGGDGSELPPRYRAAYDDSRAPEEESQEHDASGFERLNVPPEQYGPPLDDFAPAYEPERVPPKAATFVAFGVVVLAVLGVLMGIAAIRLHMQRSEMLGVLDASVGRIEAAYGGPQSEDVSQRRVAWLKQALEDGDYEQARIALESLGRPEIGEPSVPGVPGVGERPDPLSAEPEGEGERRLPSPSQDPKLPESAQQFFSEHDELWEAFFGFSTALVQMQRNNVPVDELGVLREQMVSAAAAGQTDRVAALLEQARDKIGAVGPGRAGAQLPDTLQAKLRTFSGAIQQARGQGRDIRRAVELAQQSEQAARDGNVKRAENLMDRALSALQRAPRMSRQAPAAGRRPPARPGQMPQPAAELGFLRYLTDLFGGVMRTEERDLTQVWESINIAAGAIREKNAEQVREILSDAQEALREIGQRRRNMGAAIQQAQQQLRQGRPERAETATQQREERTETVLARIGDILTRVRTMSPEEFEGKREDVAKMLLAALTAPVERDDQAPQREMTPQERVTAKMRLAGQMYLRVKNELQLDTTELDEQFASVRELIAAKRYEEAEKLADEAVGRMQAMIAGAAPDEAGGSEDYGPQLEFEPPAPSLDLRGLDQPSPDEGAEQ